MKTNILFLSAFLLLLLSCTTEEEKPSFSLENIRVRMVTPNADGTDRVDAQLIRELTGYLFEEGILTRTFPGLSVSAEGAVQGLNLTSTDSNARLFLLANATDLFDEEPVVGTVSEKDFKRLTITSKQFTGDGAPYVMTGSGRVRDLLGSKQSEIFLMRGFARFDIEAAPGVSILELSLQGVATSAYLFGQNPIASPADTKKSSLDRTFPTPITGEKTGVFYLYEQVGEPIEVSVLTEMEGVKNRLTAKLPSKIKRNFGYTLKVNHSGAMVDLKVEEYPWQEGDHTGSAPDLSEKVSIDLTSSILPDGVRVNEEKDMVYIPYYGESLELVLDSKADLELVLNGMDSENSGITITPVSSSTRANGTLSGNAFRIQALPTPPNSPERYIYMEIRSKKDPAYYGGRITIVINENPTSFSGPIYEFFDRGTECKITEYMDGELGFVDIPGDCTLSFEPDNADDSKMWIKIDPVTLSNAEELSHRYRILGGYRPNDPDADGRIQRGAFVVTHPNGRIVRYPVSRPNNGLPVTLVGDTYWCKFNLRGNARSFDDQIQISDAAAKVEDLYEYLKNCSDGEYMRLMGDAYKGINHEGMPLKLVTVNATSSYRYENYSTTNPFSVINNADPKKQCPPGYQIPDFENDFVAMLGNRNTTFSGTGNELKNSFSLNGRATTIYRFERTDINHEGGVIPRLYFNKVEFGSNPAFSYTFFGTGYQTNNTTVDLTFLLFATSGNSLSQVCGGYLSNTRKPGINETRTIRCVKSKAEYIY